MLATRKRAIALANENRGAWYSIWPRGHNAPVFVAAFREADSGVWLRPIIDGFYALIRVGPNGQQTLVAGDEFMQREGIARRAERIA